MKNQGIRLSNEAFFLGHVTGRVLFLARSTQIKHLSKHYLLCGRCVCCAFGCQWRHPPWIPSLPAYPSITSMIRWRTKEKKVIWTRSCAPKMLNCVCLDGPLFATFGEQLLSEGECQKKEYLHLHLRNHHSGEKGQATNVFFFFICQGSGKRLGISESVSPLQKVVLDSSVIPSRPLYSCQWRNGLERLGPAISMRKRAVALSLFFWFSANTLSKSFNPQLIKQNLKKRVINSLAHGRQV